MSATYTCQNPAAVEACAATCVGLQACKACSCAVIEAVEGPWNAEGSDVFFGLLPILLLVVVTVKPNPWPTSFSLPFAALCMFLVRTMYLAGDPLLSSACVILGLLAALTPLSIIAGAMMLFETMEATYCMPFMMREMKMLTDGHPVAEAMLIFGFATMVEGASGFGTPVALGAPMLVSTGNPKFESVVLLLVFNTFVTVWGAVGTPIWFGFGGLDQLSEDDYLAISSKAGVCMTIGALVLLPWVLTILLPWKLIRKNIIFVYLSVIGTMGPLIGVSFASYEFPSLLGGIIGMAVTGVLIKCKIGLQELTEEDSAMMEEHKQAMKAASGSLEDGNGQQSGDKAAADAKDGKEMEDEEVGGNSQEETAGEERIIGDTDANEKESEHTDDTAANGDNIDEILGPRKSGHGFVKDIIMRTFPVWGVVVLLILTRIEQIGLKKVLTSQKPNFEINFGTFGTFRLSASIVFQLKNILTYPNLSWKYDFIYLPFFIFTFISFLTFGLFRNNLKVPPMQVIRVVARRLKNPAMALFGALVLVQLLIRGGKSSPAFLVGTILANWFKEGFVVITPLLGALGSFFSGSTTVSNLTFGDIQYIAAESIGVSTSAMLALQAIGGSAGNGICLNNIIAACTVVDLQVSEGKILAKTARYVFSLTTIATILMLAFYFRF